MIAVIEKDEKGFIARWERPLDHSIEKVWSWLTENKKLAQWFSELRVGELRKGGYMIFDMQDGNFEKLRITELKMLSILEFKWWEDLVRFEVVQSASGCTLILKEKINNLTDHTPKDLAGWHVCLDVISALLDDRTIERMEEWKQWYGEYIQAMEKITEE